MTISMKTLIPLILSGAILSVGAQPNVRSAVADPKTSRELNPDVSFVDDFVPKIIGGVDVAQDQFPYYVFFQSRYIRDNGVYFSSCGGSLIAPDIVLTAGHCIKENTISITATIGPIARNGTGASAVRSCTNWLRHEGYGIGFRLEKDYGLCKLDQPVYINEGAEIFLELNDDNFVPMLGQSLTNEDTEIFLELNDDNSVPMVGQNLTVTGLGYTDLSYERFPNGTYVEDANGNRIPIFTRPDNVQTVTVPFIDNSVCSGASVYPGQISDNMFCAGEIAGGRGHCRGDSGGPMVLIEPQNDGSVIHRLVGIVSWSWKFNTPLDQNGCAITNRPGVYARVSSQLDWIKRTACINLGSVASFCNTNPPSPAPVCEAQGAAPYTDDEYVVVQYNSSVFTSCLDLGNPAHQSALADAYMNAYMEIDLDCTQNGAHCEIFDAQFVASDSGSDTFLLRLSSFCNSWRYLNDDKALCGVELFSVYTGPPVVGLPEGDPNRKLKIASAFASSSGEICSCPPPFETDVIDVFNANVETFVNSACAPPEPLVVTGYAVATDQLCELPCANDTSVPGEIATDDYTYSANGVSAPCLTNSPSARPRPTKKPKKCAKKRSRKCRKTSKKRSKRL